MRGPLGSGWGYVSRGESYPRERVEGLLQDEKDARIALQGIFIPSFMKERESKTHFLDGFEELEGYYQGIRWDLVRLCTFLSMLT